MNAEQTVLLRMAAEKLGAARVLIEAGYYGSAVSEAYYVMFDAAKAILIGKNILRHKHGAVIAAFGEHFAKPGLVRFELHQWIIAAEKDRLIADYSVEDDLDISIARRHLERAETFLERISSLLEND